MRSYELAQTQAVDKMERRLGLTYRKPTDLALSLNQRLIRTLTKASSSSLTLTLFAHSYRAGVSCVLSCVGACVERFPVSSCDRALTCSLHTARPAQLSQSALML